MMYKILISMYDKVSQVGMIPIYVIILISLPQSYGQILRKWQILRKSVSWLADLENIFQNFECIFSTKML